MENRITDFVMREKEEPMDDLISRKAVYDELFDICNEVKKLAQVANDNTLKNIIEAQKAILIEIKMRIAKLPAIRSEAAQPELDEWCTDCKEYNQDRHCCPRWNRVIRETVEELRRNAQPY